MTLFVHIGTHKTGTTSIQNFFSRNSDYLFERKGIYYPQSGQISSGSHHNLVWETVEDIRFRKNLGTWRDLYFELKNLDKSAKHVLLSCEAFSSYVDYEKVTNPISELAVSIGMDTSSIVFLRPQSSYIESLYFEDIKSGIGDSFSTYVRKCLKTSRFNYLKLVDGWSNFLDEIKVVPYYPGFDSLELLIDSLNIDLSDLKFHNKSRFDKKNLRLSSYAISCLLAMNRALIQKAASKSFRRKAAYNLAVELAQIKGASATVLTPPTMDMISKTFKSSNDTLARKYLDKSILFTPTEASFKNHASLLEEEVLRSIEITVSQFLP